MFWEEKKDIQTLDETRHKKAGQAQDPFQPSLNSHFSIRVAGPLVQTSEPQHVWVDMHGWLFWTLDPDNRINRLHPLIGIPWLYGFTEYRSVWFISHSLFNLHKLSLCCQPMAWNLFIMRRVMTTCIPNHISPVSFQKRWAAVLHKSFLRIC